ncbi:MAG: PAS domain S-box protein [Melioribacteraceae bacterium]|nr:PAS domain S-box protein [Melioribacteraceae bacterium]
MKKNSDLLFHSIRDAILIADTERNIIDCNDAFSEIFGYSLEEIKGKKTLSIYENEEQFNELGKAIKEHFGDKPFNYTVNFKRKDGNVFPGETGSILFEG